MITVAQLRDEVAFAAGIPDIDAMGGWFYNELTSVLNEYTSTVRLDDLYKSNNPILMVGIIDGVAPLPTGLQHLDELNVRFSKGGDPNQTYTLTQGRILGPNQGPPTTFIRSAKSSSAGRISVYPFADIVDADQLIINYWQTLTLGSDTSTYIPEMLGPVVRAEMIARANLYLGDGKKVAAAAEIARSAFSRGLGSTNLGSQNW